MGLLQDVFKRKPGGTMVGNMIRGVSKTAANSFLPGSGLLVGNGGMMITQQDADKRDLSDSDYMTLYGVSKDGHKPSVLPALAQQFGAVLSGGLPALAAMPTGPLTAASRDIQANLEAGASKGFMGMLHTYALPIFGALGVLITIIFFIFKKKGRR